LGHRIVATIVRLVLLLFAASGLVFALAVRDPVPPGPGIPATHRNFSEGTCGTCHAPPRPDPAGKRGVLLPREPVVRAAS